MATEKERERALRPSAAGRAGKSVILFANYFMVICACKKAHHYNLVVTPLPIEESTPPPPMCHPAVLQMLTAACHPGTLPCRACIDPAE